jgi:SAM-dependent methyltransferase
MEERATRRRLWERAVEGWLAFADAQARQTLPVAVALVEGIRPQPGHRVLELAAGLGDVGFMAAELIQPGGELVCTDWSPGMLTGAQERARALGVAGVRFKQVDLEQPLDFEAASFDGALCRWGLMLVPDGEAVLRDVRRILRPGGRLALAAWTAAEDNPWMAAPGAELRSRGLAEAPAPGALGPFAWGPDGRIATFLEDAGFVEHEVRALEWRLTFPDFGAYWNQQSRLSPSLGEALARVDAPARAEIKAAIAARLAPHTAADGSLTLPARTWVAVAEA